MQNYAGLQQEELDICEQNPNDRKPKKPKETPFSLK